MGNRLGMAILAGVLVLLLSPAPSQAQKGGGGGRGGGGGGGMRGGSPGGGAMRGPGGGGFNRNVVIVRGGYGYGLGGYGYGGYGYGLGGYGYGLGGYGGYGGYGGGYGGYGGGYGGYGGYGYGSNYGGYGSAYGNGGAMNAYPYPPNNVPPMPPVDPNYNAPSATGGASIQVIVPPAAEIWFDGVATAQRGPNRAFQTPALDPNRTFTYTLRARWMQNGQAVDLTRSVQVRAGQQSFVDFTVADPQK